MDDYSQIKQEIRAIQQIKVGQSRYGLFLDKLAMHRMTSQEKEEAFDLEYFSLNTDLCRNSAKFYQAIIQQITSLFNNDGQIYDIAPFTITGTPSYDDQGEHMVHLRYIFMLQWIRFSMKSTCFMD
jgi:hypothetical protein